MIHYDHLHSYSISTKSKNLAKLKEANASVPSTILISSMDITSMLETCPNYKKALLAWKRWQSRSYPQEMLLLQEEIQNLPCPMLWENLHQTLLATKEKNSEIHAEFCCLHESSNLEISKIYQQFFLTDEKNDSWEIFKQQLARCFDIQHLTHWLLNGLNPLDFRLAAQISLIPQSLLRGKLNSPDQTVYIENGQTFQLKKWNVFPTDFFIKKSTTLQNILNYELNCIINKIDKQYKHYVISWIWTGKKLICTDLVPLEIEKREPHLLVEYPIKSLASNEHKTLTSNRKKEDFPQTLSTITHVVRYYSHYMKRKFLGQDQSYCDTFRNLHRNSMYDIPKSLELTLHFQKNFEQKILRTKEIEQYCKNKISSLNLSLLLEEMLAIYQDTCEYYFTCDDLEKQLYRDSIEIWKTLNIKNSHISHMMPKPTFTDKEVNATIIDFCQILKTDPQKEIFIKNLKNCKSQNEFIQAGKNFSQETYLKWLKLLESLCQIKNNFKLYQETFFSDGNFLSNNILNIIDAEKISAKSLIEKEEAIIAINNAFSSCENNHTKQQYIHQLETIAALKETKIKINEQIFPIIQTLNLLLHKTSIYLRELGCIDKKDDILYLQWNQIKTTLSGNELYLGFFVQQQKSVKMQLQESAHVSEPIHRQTVSLAFE